MLKSIILVAALLMLPVSTHYVSDFIPAEIQTMPGKILDMHGASQYSSTSICKCGRDQVIDLGSRRLFTNLWGAPSHENISLNENCVFRSYGASFGWMWNRMDPVASGKNNVLPIYPSVATGTDPWGGYSTSSKYLPVRIMNISSFILDVRYSYSALPSSSDSVNLAYDIWITDTDNPNPGTPRNEVMIWLNRLNVPMPEDKRGEDVSDGYNTYTHYSYDGNYHAFIMNVEPSSGVKYHKANPKKLIDYLVTKGDLSGDLWVSRIDLGSEVWKGDGKLEIQNLNVMINNIFI